MKKSFSTFCWSLVMALIGLSASQPLIAQGSWTAAAPMPTARMGLASVTGPDGHIYVMGGFNGSWINTVESYDPAANTWTTVAPMPTSHYYLESAAALGPDGRIYAMGGYYRNPTVEAYTPGTNTWTTVAPMPTGRFILAAATGGDGRIYAIGGDTGGGGETVDTVEAYDVGTDSWTTVASLPESRSTHAAVTGKDGRIYVFGGARATPTGFVFITAVVAYDPATNTWSNRASMPTARSHPAAVLGPDGKMYVFGGDLPGSGVTSIVEAYDPATDTWTQKASMPTARSILAAAGSFDHRIFTFGGTADGGVTEFNVTEAYMPYDLVSMSLSPASVIGCKPSTGKVTINAPAPPGGLAVIITTTNPAAIVPPSITIPGGATSKTFTVKTTAVSANTTGNITATLGAETKSAKLTVKPISVKSITLSPDQVTGGSTSTGIVILECPAAPGNITVTLSSSNPAVASLPSSIVISAGSSVGTFAISTSSVSALTAVTIKAKAGGVTKSDVLDVFP